MSQVEKQKQVELEEEEDEKTEEAQQSKIPFFTLLKL